ncbi:hypothetical protein RM863_40360, partial [Streptomyces sp. DSM 41014]|nr:hypothetical protein [Streptomyces sp. DSM 41014]
ADKLLNAIGDGSQYGVTIHWSIEPEEPLETAGGIKMALATGKLKDQPFILVNGDVWTPFDFAQLSHLKLNDSQAYLLLTDQATHNPTGDFALENGKVNVEGTPKYTFAGISVMSPRLLDTVKVGETAPLAPLLKQAMQAGLVMGDL